MVNVVLLLAAACVATPTESAVLQNVAASAGVSHVHAESYAVAPNCLFQETHFSSDALRHVDDDVFIIGGSGPSSLRSMARRLLESGSQAEHSPLHEAGGACMEERNSAGVAIGDVNGDGADDLIFSRLHAQPLLYLASGNGTFQVVRPEDSGLVMPAPPAGHPALKHGNFKHSVLLGSNGVVLVDVDNDGDEDVYITSMGGVAHGLFMNDGSGHFSEEAALRGATGRLEHDTGLSAGGSIGVVDFDGDGWLDLYVTEWRIATHSDPVHSKAWRPSNSVLLRNKGQGFFEDATASAGLQLERLVAALVHARYLSAEVQDDDSALMANGIFSFSPVWRDLDGDGSVDLLLAADFGSSALFRGAGNGTFTDASLGHGFGYEENGMGACTWDLQGRGLEADTFITAIHGDDGGVGNDGEGGRRRVANTGYGTSGNELYLVREEWLEPGAKAQQVEASGEFAGSSQALRRALNFAFLQGNWTWLANATDVTGTRASHWAWGCVFADLLNSGTPALLVNNGYSLPESTLDDAMDWESTASQAYCPPAACKKLPGQQQCAAVKAPPLTWMPEAEGPVSGTANRLGLLPSAPWEPCADALGFNDTGHGRGVALWDMDADGALDALVTNFAGPPLLLHNTAASLAGSWLRLQVRTGWRQRYAIGASVLLRVLGADGAILTQQARTVGSSSHFLAQSPAWLHFGLGELPKEATMDLQVSWHDRGCTMHMPDIPLSALGSTLRVVPPCDTPPGSCSVAEVGAAGEAGQSASCGAAQYPWRSGAPPRAQVHAGCLANDCTDVSPLQTCCTVPAAQQGSAAYTKDEGKAAWQVQAKSLFESRQADASVPLTPVESDEEIPGVRAPPAVLKALLARLRQRLEQNLPGQPLDARGNNAANPDWGAGKTTLRRLFSAAYEDGVAAPAGASRPSARNITRTMHRSLWGMEDAAEDHVQHVDGLPVVNSLFMHFGQFLAHELSHSTPQPNAANSEYMPMTVEEDDPAAFTTLKIRRSMFDPATGKHGKPRQQINHQTAFIDASAVYGARPKVGNALRANVNGLLLDAEEEKSSFTDMSSAMRSMQQKETLSKCLAGKDRSQQASQPRSGSLPLAARSMVPTDNPLAKVASCLTATGDPRGNAQLGLTATHALLVRLHNWLAKALVRHASEVSARDTSLPRDLRSKLQAHMPGEAKVLDEAVFQTVREAVAAVLQMWTYHEYLPALLGSGWYNATVTGCRREPQGKCILTPDSYDATRNPSISTEFSTVAFRFGHAQAADSLAVDVAACALSPRGCPHLRLNDSYFVELGSDIPLQSDGLPQSLPYGTHGSVWTNMYSRILRGSVGQPSRPVGATFAPGVHHRLFGTHTQGGMVDLPAINIQRGRDHGIPSLDAFQLAARRAGWLGPGVLRPELQPGAGAALKAAYGELGVAARDVDAFIGGLLEVPVPGALVGPSFAHVIGEQFEALAQGDANLHTRVWSDAHLQALWQGLSMRRVLCSLGVPHTAGKSAALFPAGKSNIPVHPAWKEWCNVEPVAGAGPGHPASVFSVPGMA